MKVIKPSYEIQTPIIKEEVYKHLERVGRTCYKSEDKITVDSAERFLRGIVSRGHESVIEHYSFSVKFICDRGVSHEIVRHRIFSFAQESTRYCNYSKDKFDGEITVIRPCFWPMDTKEYQEWLDACLYAERKYMNLLEGGAKPEEARSVLPHSLKTELVVTGNVREWRHFFRLRTSIAAHPQIREIAIPLLEELKQLLPVLFEDIKLD